MEEKQKPTEVSGIVGHFIYRNETNGYAILVLESGGVDITCVGNCHDLQEGESVSFEGEFVENPTYGWQFKFSKYHIQVPSDEEAIERYLGSGAIKGVGQKLAARIVAVFGADTMRILEEEPERLAEIKGISLHKAMEIASSLEERRDMRDAMIFLAGFNISQHMAVKIYEVYGERVYQVMKENPYKLAEDVDGIGFVIADRLAEQAGIPRNSEHRTRCGILYILQQAAANGHCYLPLAELEAEATSLLECDRETLMVQLDGLVIDHLVFKRDDHVYLRIYYNAEVRTAAMLAQCNLCVDDMNEIATHRLEEKVARLADEQGMELEEHQLLAVKTAARNGIFILTGGPGTGKTTTINLIIRYFISQGDELLLAAPTGRAAKRMSEATGYEATTIHRLLGVGGNSEDGGKAYFQRNEDNPLEADVVIIDEMSMVDILLFQALLRAIVPGTRLILVGDAFQLPSVGAGAVLKDLIDSKAFPCVHLTKIFRQAMDSDIIVNAHSINRGEQIRLDTNSKDFLFLERNDTRIIKDTIVWLVRDKLPLYCDCSPMDVQVLTPMRKGALGCQEMNAFLQQALNPPDKKKKEHYVGDQIFREGDKVMQIKNNYQLEWEVQGFHGICVDSGTGVFNGDMGTILEISEAANFIKIEFDDARVVLYPMNLLEEIELAYAVTIHKSQGSEYPAVVMPLLEVPRTMAYRNLLYTGITRAKNCVTILGSADTVRRMIDNTGENKRYSSLAERVTEIM